MGRISRVIIPGCAHHLTQRGVRSMDVFRDEADRRLYLSLLIEQAREHHLRFLAWCLMSNHVHFVVVPPRENSLARAIGEAHRRYTWQVNRREGVRGYLFQGRFFSCPLDALHGMEAIRYVERNPVRAGMVKQAWDYPWSSAPWRVGKRKDDPLLSEKDRLGTTTEWRALLRVDPPDATLLRKRTATGRPCGDAAFTTKLERLTGRSLHLGPRGRPRKEA